MHKTLMKYQQDSQGIEESNKKMKDAEREIEKYEHAFTTFTQKGQKESMEVLYLLNR